MNLKRELILFILITALAQKAYPAVDIDFSSSYVTRYIWRGQDLFPNNDGAFCPSINLSTDKLLKNTTLDLNIWAALPLSAGHQNAEEIDYTLSLTHNFLQGKITISEGYTYFDYPRINSTSDVQELWTSLSFNNLGNSGISLNLFAGYNFKAESGGPEDGWYYSWGLSKDFLLPKGLRLQPDQSLSLSITNWGTDGAGGLPYSPLYATDLSLSTVFNLKKVTITPSLNYTVNHKDDINSGNEEFWSAIEINYSF
jgi:hypothetical protein